MKRCQLDTAPNISHVGATLKMLDMSNNQQTSLPVDYFEYCNTLEMIFLEFNALFSLPDLQYVAHSLKGIDVGGNELTHLDSLHKWQFPALRGLHVYRKVPEF